MKRLLALLFLILLCGCAASSDPLAYQRDGGMLSLSGQIDSLSFAAELSLDPLAEGVSADTRGFTLRYTAPDSLAGITLASANGQTTLTRGAVSDTVTDARYAGLTLPAALFCIDCEIGSAAVVEQNGATLNLVTAADDEGSYTLWLDERGFPRRIEAVISGRTISADILAVTDGMS